MWKSCKASHARWSLLILLLIMLFSAQAIAQTDQRIFYQIPAGTLSHSLTEVAAMAGVMLVIQPSLVENRTADALDGHYTLQEAFNRLLDRTGLTLVQTGADSYRLEQHASEVTAVPQAMDTLTVIGVASAIPDAYEIPAGISVIDRAELNTRAITHAGDILEHVSGAYAITDYKDPGLSINLRGIQDYGRVNANIEGMRQNFVYNGTHQQRNSRMYIDPLLISNAIFEKTPSAKMGHSGTLIGQAQFNLLNVNDVVLEDQRYGGLVRLQRGIEPWDNGMQLSGVLTGGFRTQHWDGLLAYAETHTDNYTAGQKGFGGEAAAWNAYYQMWKQQWSKVNESNYPNVWEDEIPFSWRESRSVLGRLGWNLATDQRLDFMVSHTGIQYDTGALFDQRDQSQLPVNFFWYRTSQNDIAASNLALDYSYNPVSDLINLQAKLYYVDTRLEQQRSQVLGRYGHLEEDPAPHMRPRRVENYVRTTGLQLQNASFFELSPRSLFNVSYGLEAYQDDNWGKDYSNSVQEYALLIEQYDPDHATGQQANWSTAPLTGLNPQGKKTFASGFINTGWDWSDWFSAQAGLAWNYSHLEGETQLIDQVNRPISVAQQEANIARGYHPLTGRTVAEVMDISLDATTKGLAPSLGFAIRPSLELELFANWSRSFRTPAVTEVLASGNAHGNAMDILPNPNLKEERTEFWEVGANYMTGNLFIPGDNLQAKLTYSQSEIENFMFYNSELLYRNPDNDAASRSWGADGVSAMVNNIHDVTIKTVELDLAYDAQSWYARLNYTRYLDFDKNKFCSASFYYGAYPGYDTTYAGSVASYSQPVWQLPTNLNFQDALGNNVSWKSAFAGMWGGGNWQGHRLASDFDNDQQAFKDWALQVIQDYASTNGYTVNTSRLMAFYNSTLSTTPGTTTEYVTEQQNLGGFATAEEAAAYAAGQETCAPSSGSTYLPDDQGMLVLGIRPFNQKLDLGLRMRFSSGFNQNLREGALLAVNPNYWPSYQVYDFYAVYTPSRNLTLNLNLENLLDQAYSPAGSDTFAATLAKGRTLMGAVQYRF